MYGHDYTATRLFRPPRPHPTARSTHPVATTPAARPAPSKAVKGGAFAAGKQPPGGTGLAQGGEGRAIVREANRPPGGTAPATTVVEPMNRPKSAKRVQVPQIAAPGGRARLLAASPSGSGKMGCLGPLQRRQQGPPHGGPCAKSGGGSRIRTHESFHSACFQDKCLQPLGHSSKAQTEYHTADASRLFAIKWAISPAANSFDP